MKEPTTITVEGTDKRKFKGLVYKYNTEQFKLFKAMVKIIKKYDPEIKDELK